MVTHTLQTLFCISSDYEARIKNFGSGDGRYWFDELACSGNETDLLECPSNGLGIHDCWEYEAVGVICGKINCVTFLDLFDS